MLSYEHLVLIAEIVAVATGIGRAVAPALFLLTTRVWGLILVVLLAITLVVLNVVESRTLSRTLWRYSDMT